MPLLIRNGRIITSTDDYIADIYCAGETITRIEKRIDNPRTGGTPMPPANVPPANLPPANVSPDTEIIDAAGKYVFPGFIDPHVHIYLPFMGTFSKDTYETGSKAALVGGTTTLIEMCCPSRKEEALAGFETWMSQAVGKSACDFTF